MYKVKPVTKQPWVTTVRVEEKASQDLVDYQIRIELNQDNFDFDKAAADGSDLWVTDKEGSPLYYWIQEWSKDAKHAVVWVKLPQLKANDFEVLLLFHGANENPYMQYRDPSQVFLFFDHFNNLDNWTVQESGGTASVSDSKVTLSPVENADNAVALLSSNTFVKGFAVEAVVDPQDQYYFDIGIVTVTSLLTDTWHGVEKDNLGYWLCAQEVTNETLGYYLSRRDTGSKTILVDAQGGGHALQKIYYMLAYDENGKLVGKVRLSDGSERTTLIATDTTYLDDAKHIAIWQGEYSNGQGAPSSWDWVFVRKYVDPEPQVTVEHTTKSTLALQHGIGYSLVELEINAELNKASSCMFKTPDSVNVGQCLSVFRRGQEIFRGYVVQVNRREGFNEVRCVDLLWNFKRRPFMITFIDSTLDDILKELQLQVGIPMKYDGSAVTPESRTWDTTDELSTLQITNGVVQDGYIVFRPGLDIQKSTDTLPWYDDYNDCDDYAPYAGWSWYESGSGDAGMFIFEDVHGNKKRCWCFDVGSSAGEAGCVKTFDPIVHYGKLIFERSKHDDHIRPGVKGDFDNLNLEDTENFSELGYSFERLYYTLDNISELRIYNNTKDSRAVIDNIHVQEWASGVRNIPSWIVKVKLYDQYGGLREEMVPTDGWVYINHYKYGDPFDCYLVFVDDGGNEMQTATNTMSRTEIWDTVEEPRKGEAVLTFKPENSAGWDKLDAVLIGSDWEIYVLDENNNVLKGPFTEADLPINLADLTQETLKFKFVAKDTTTEERKIDSITVYYYSGGVDIDFAKDGLDALQAACKMFGRYIGWEEWDVLLVKKPENIGQLRDTSFLATEWQTDQREYANVVILYYNGGYVQVRDDNAVSQFGEYVKVVANKDITSKPSAEQYAQSLLQHYTAQRRLQAHVTDWIYPVDFIQYENEQLRVLAASARFFEKGEEINISAGVELPRISGQIQRIPKTEIWATQ